MAIERFEDIETQDNQESEVRSQGSRPWPLDLGGFS